MSFTVWELMNKIGIHDKFNIYVCGKKITGDIPVSVSDCELLHEERELVHDSLERAVSCFVPNTSSIYCE